MSPSSPRSDSPENRPVLSMADERERILQELSQHFANDHLSLDELDSRMERAYKSTTVAELKSLTADLPRLGSVAPARPDEVMPAPASVIVPERERLLSVMSETKRAGLWAAPQRLDLVAVMSDTTIDLTQAILPPGIVDVHVRSLWAAVKIIVPPGLQVVNRMGSLMSSVHAAGEPDDDRHGGTAWRSDTVIRLSGWAVMAEIQTKVRRREER